MRATGPSSSRSAHGPSTRTSGWSLARRSARRQRLPAPRRESGLGLRGGRRVHARRRGVPFEYVEEPLADPGTVPDLIHEFGVPVALDESLIGLEPEDLEEHRYARAVVLKPTLLGGISRTLRTAERALRLGMTPVISSAYESGVGTAALVALAAGVGECPAAAGLDTYRMLAERRSPDAARAAGTERKCWRNFDRLARS